MTRMDATSPTSLDRRLSAAGVVVAALALGVVLMAVAGSFVVPRADGAPPTISFAFVAVAFFAMLGSVLTRRLMFTPLRLTNVFETGGEAGLGDYVFRVTVVSAALAEAVAVVGLVLGIVTGDSYYMYALCFIALLGILSNYPRAGRWRDLIADMSARTRAGAASGSFGAGR